MRRVGLEDEKGIRIGGRNINNLRYADDTTTLAERKRDWWRKRLETWNEQILKDRRGRQWQTTPGLKNCLGNPDTGSPGVYADSKELLLLLLACCLEHEVC